MISHAQGELLAQVRPGVTTAVQLIKSDTLRIEITLLVATIIEGGTAMNLFVYHDDSGSDVYDNSTIIFSANKQLTDPDLLFQAQHPGSGIIIKPGGSLGVKIATASNATFSVYGITETLAGRVRGLSNG